jgi:hypothetical protein
VSLALASRRAALLAPWNKNELWRRAKAVPSLDLRFAENKSLVDATTGQNLVTFSRASGATYVDSQGVIRNAVTNLLLRSEEFGTTWTATRSSISGDTTTAPNGLSTADKIVEDTTASNTHLVNQSFTITSGVAYTASVYAKASERTWLAIYPTVGGINAGAWFNLSTGALGVVQANATAAISGVGNGWYRCSITWTSTNTTTAVNLAIANNNNSVSYTGDGTSGIYLWGAQLEQSSTVGEYVPTGATINSAPRFDHNPVTGESLGLLVEEQRTNLLLYSEQFDNAWWSKTRASVTANATTAPDGLTTADKLVEDNTASASHRLDASVVSFPSGAMTASLFAKAAERSQLQISWDGNPGGVASSAACVFNLATGTAGTPSSTSNISSPVGSIIAYANGWYRIILTATATASFTGTFRANLLDNSGNAVYSGDNASGLFIWGAQLE